ncbi:Flp pilus assembly protein CpaB [bacterium]|nr:Flp pilus assembly protein CpaB [bacterium]
MKPQTLIMLVVALGCGLAAMVMTQRFLTVPVEEKVPGTMVLVASIDIKPGEKINDQIVKLVEWPKDVVPANALNKLEDAVGRSARFPMGANEVVTIAKLAAEGIGPGLEPIIEEGMRAMSVPIKTHESAAGFIKPSSRVDIVMIARGNGANGKSKTILQNVRVIAVNHSISEKADEGEKGTVVEMITFLLSPEEAESLALAQNTGAIQLVLRNPLEDTFVKTKGVNQDDLLRGSSKYQEATDKPKDGEKVNQGPGALQEFLTKLMGDKGKKNEGQALSAAVPVIQFTPSPPEKKKRLIYRDLQGNVLMEVVLDADDKIAEDLEGLLEDVEEDELVSSFNPSPNSPGASAPPTNLPSSAPPTEQSEPAVEVDGL